MPWRVTFPCTRRTSIGSVLPCCNGPPWSRRRVGLHARLRRQQARDAEWGGDGRRWDLPWSYASGPRGQHGRLNVDRRMLQLEAESEQVSAGIPLR